MVDAGPEPEIEDEIQDEEDEDDFIEYGEGERPLRRRDPGMSAEMAEMIEEQEGIFGSAQEMQELLEFTKGLPDDGAAQDSEVRQRCSPPPLPTPS